MLSSQLNVTSKKTIINFSNLFLGRFFLGLFVIFSFAFLPVIFAENLAVSSAKAAEGNFAVVNLKNIVGKAKASKDIERQLKKMREVFEKEVASTEKSLKKDNQKLQEQKDETSQKIFDLKLKEFQLRLKDEKTLLFFLHAFCLLSLFGRLAKLAGAHSRWRFN